MPLFCLLLPASPLAAHAPGFGGASPTGAVPFVAGAPEAGAAVGTAWGASTGPETGEVADLGGLEGRVRDGAGVPLRVVSVVVVAPDGRVLRAVTTDETGYWRVQPLPAGPVVVRFLRIGFDPTEVEVEVPESGRVVVNVELTERAVTLRGVEVEGAASRARSRFETETGVTVRELAGSDIRSLPGLAEADPIRAIEVLPGVTAPTDFSAAFHVRGGSSDQNLILLDGFPIFNPFHLGGIFSVFNADMVDRVELSSGGFPAEYGGRVSSVLRIETDPGRGETEVDGGVSLLAARATLSGGLPQGVREGVGLGSARWRLSARRSYVDQLVRPVTELPYHITDLQGVFEGWTPGGSRWTVTGYRGADVLDLGRIQAEDFPLRIYWEWGNAMLGTRYLRAFEGGSQLEARAGMTRFETELRFEDFDDSRFSSRVEQLTLFLGGSVPVGGGWEVRTGVSADRYDWANFGETAGTIFGDDGLDGWNGAAWLQGSWRSPGAWALDAGLRVEGWSGGGASILEPTPRLAVRRFLGEDLAVKASVGRYTQFVHSLRDEELPLGIDFWITAAEAVPHVVSDQLQVGVEAFPAEGWFVSADAFWRDFQGVVTQNPVNDPNDPDDVYLSGRGSGWGADAFVERRTGAVQGSLSLSFLRADRTFPDVFSGRDPRGEVTFPPLFDRRLDADLVLRFPMGRGWEGGLRWHVGTGLPYTRPVAAFPFMVPRQSRDGRLRWSPDDEAEIAEGAEAEGPGAVFLGPRNAERYPTYHRLDLSTRRTFEPSWGLVTPYLSVLNAYNQPNVLFYFFDFDAVPATRSGLTMFPFLPTVGVEIRFR